MRRLFCAALILAAACDRSGEQQAVPADTTVTDSVQAPAANPNDSTMRPGTKFDATRIDVGERVAGLELTAKNVQPAPKSLLGVSGSMSFKGEVELTGGYRAHYEYPEVKEACFWADPGEWKKLPRQHNDSRIPWFCFTNKEQAIAQLAPLGQNLRATIVIDDYTTNLQQADVWDQARLVRVVKKEKSP